MADEQCPCPREEDVKLSLSLSLSREICDVDGNTVLQGTKRARGVCVWRLSLCQHGENDSGFGFGRERRERGARACTNRQTIWARNGSRQLEKQPPRGLSSGESSAMRESLPTTRLSVPRNPAIQEFSPKGCAGHELAVCVVNILTGPTHTCPFSLF